MQEPAALRPTVVLYLADSSDNSTSDSKRCWGSIVVLAAQAAVTPWVNITGKGLYTLLVVDPDAAKGNASAPAGEWCADLLP